MSVCSQNASFDYNCSTRRKDHLRNVRTQVGMALHCWPLSSNMMTYLDAALLARPLRWMKDLRFGGLSKQTTTLHADTSIPSSRALVVITRFFLARRRSSRVPFWFLRSAKSPIVFRRPEKLDSPTNVATLNHGACIEIIWDKTATSALVRTKMRPENVVECIPRRH